MNYEKGGRCGGFGVVGYIGGRVFEVLFGFDVLDVAAGGEGGVEFEGGGCDMLVVRLQKYHVFL